MTQTTRLRDFLQSHPRSSSLEIQRALTITNATGRMSDLRELGQREGFRVVKERRTDGRDGYRLEPVGPLTLFKDVA